MSDRYGSEAEALADALPPYAGTFRQPGGESTSAALRRAETERNKAIRERDSLARRCALRFEETEKLRGELIRAGQEIERLRGNETRWAAEVEHAEAELASARESLDARTRALVRARAEIGALIADLDEARQDVEIERTEVANLRRVQTELDGLRAQLLEFRELLDQATGRHGTTLCPRCGDALAAEVAGETP